MSFIDFTFCKECGLGTTQFVRKSFCCQKSKTPILTWTVLCMRRRVLCTTKSISWHGLKKIKKSRRCGVRRKHLRTLCNITTIYHLCEKRTRSGQEAGKKRARSGSTAAEIRLTRSMDLLVALHHCEY